MINHKKKNTDKIEKILDSVWCATVLISDDTIPKKGIKYRRVSNLT